MRVQSEKIWYSKSMRFLQTGDWHLGKIFHEQPLLDDQRAFLAQISAELAHAVSDTCPYDALVVPGDIYDRAVPPSEAVILLSSFLNETHTSFPEMQIFMTAGNHDSAERLSFASQLLASSNIHICTDTARLAEPVIFGQGEDSTAVYQIPFLTPGSLKKPSAEGDLFADDALLRSQQNLAAEAVRIIRESHQAHYPHMMSVVTAHLFSLAGHVSASERSCVGTAEQVDADLFAPFTYTALGHLHGVQCAGKTGHVMYSGSPLAYSFDDAPDTYMLSVTLHGGSASVRKIPFTPIHPVVRLTGPFSLFYGETADRDLIAGHSSSYVEIICTDASVPDNPMALLRLSFPHILSFAKQVQEAGKQQESIEKRRVLMEPDKADQASELFEMFIEDVYGKERDDADLYRKETELFTKLASHYTWREN